MAATRRQTSSASEQLNNSQPLCKLKTSCNWDGLKLKTELASLRSKTILWTTTNYKKRHRIKTQSITSLPNGLQNKTHSLNSYFYYMHLKHGWKFFVDEDNKDKMYLHTAHIFTHRWFKLNPTQVVAESNWWWVLCWRLNKNQLSKRNDIVGYMKQDALCCYLFTNSVSIKSRVRRTAHIIWQQ